MQQQKNIYIRPDYGYSNPGHYSEPSEVKDRNINLISYLEKSFVSRSTQSRYIILAGSGMGKSALLFNLYNRYLKRFFRNYKMCLIELSFKASLDDIDKIESPENTILLLDALDENIDAINDLHSTIKKVSDKTQRFYRVVVLTCRTEFFNRAEEIPGILTNISGVIGAGEHKKGTYEKLFLYPFTSGQIETFLIYKYLLSIRQLSLIRYIKARKTFKKVPYISVRPMLLTYIDYLLKVDIDSKYSFKIYEAMIYGWLQRRKSDELDPSPKDNFKFVYNLAIEMARNYSKNGGYFVKKEEAEKLANMLDSNLTEWQIPSRSLLNIDASGNYKFAHLSIMEVLLARAHINGENFGDWEMSALTKKFIAEMVEQKVDNTLSISTAPKTYYDADMTHEFERLGFKIQNKQEQNTDSEKDAEHKSIYLESTPKDFGFVDISGKFFENMSFRKYSFRGADLTNIKMKNCDLTNTDLTGANLSEAIFEKCNFSSSCFLGAILTSTQFIGCNLGCSDFSVIRIKDGYKSDSHPIFKDSELTGSTVPNDYAEYFRETPNAKVKRDLENIKLV
ncbi:MAG: pentapeptide repeat-containing protein [Methylococcales bacterium]|nr:pentapeptide repeat-containing protein [Methylococcales bacterium]